MWKQEPPPGGWGRGPGQGPPSPAGQGWGTPPPPRRGAAGRIIGFSCLGALTVVALLLIGGLLLGGGGNPDRRPVAPESRPAGTEAPTGREATGPKGDVQITACGVDSSTGWPSADLLITNRSSKPSTYLVHVEFVDAAGRRLSEAYASSSGVAPGQQSAVEAQGLDQVPAGTVCRITDVTRFAS
ncbi:FxLYD domain-containing protein [Streptomyces sp. NRRL F-2664]|uniref:FxLYD domain-containing protein n=1 Tax=Streptomyces sp. NRRL F-2664 TaxID=1463842 RepID=UPI003B637BFE